MRWSTQAHAGAVFRWVGVMLAGPLVWIDAGVICGQTIQLEEENAELRTPNIEQRTPAPMGTVECRVEVFTSGNIREQAVDFPTLNSQPSTLNLPAQCRVEVFTFANVEAIDENQPIVETEPLSPSEFNPDPGAGRPIEAEAPPDLFPPILPQLPDYGEEALPRSLELPRKGVREMVPQRRKLEYEDYPDAEEGEGLLPNSRPVPNRWFVGFGRWKRYADPSTETAYQSDLHLWHPYLQSKFKGDAPIIGQDIFLNLTAEDFFQFETRTLPTPSGVSTARPNSSEFFGRGEQLFYANDFSIGIDLFKGETAFKPVEWAVRVLGVYNHNYIDTEENRVVNPNPQEGTDREKEFFSLQEAFAEIHIRDLSSNYDFISSRIGIQPFISDFRGFIFNDTNLGIRIFGNYDNNKWQYNIAAFDMLEKDTYSDLNEFKRRDQQVYVANLFRQDLIWKGYTGELSFLANFDNNSRHYDKNGFITRPAPIGTVGDHYLQSYYMGWTGDGHIGWLNIDHAYYHVFGEDSLNGIAGRHIDISADMAALELSIDNNWLRHKVSVFYGSGDTRPTNATGTGFDTVLDRPFFAGGPFSFFSHQGFNLGGTFVNFKQRDSLVIDFRTSKTEGQSNFVNPGVLITGYGLDADILPRLRGFLNANYIRTIDTRVTELVQFTNHASEDFGLDCSLGFEWRPLLTDNIIVTAGAGFFVPRWGYKFIYRTNTDPVHGYPGPPAGEVDDFLYSGIVTVTLTY